MLYHSISDKVGYNQSEVRVNHRPTLFQCCILPSEVHFGWMGPSIAFTKHSRFENTCWLLEVEFLPVGPTKVTQLKFHKAEPGLGKSGLN